MANQNEKRGILDIDSIAADWDYKVSKPGNWPVEPRISSIQFVPGAAADKLVVKDYDANGPIVMLVTAETANAQKIKYFHGGRCIPYIDESECTLSANHRVIIHLWSDI